MCESDFLKLLLENRSSPDAWARSILEATSDLPEHELAKLIPLFNKAFRQRKLSPLNGKELIAALQQLGFVGKTPDEDQQINSLRAKTEQLKRKRAERLDTNDTLQRLKNQTKEILQRLSNQAKDKTS